MSKEYNDLLFQVAKLYYEQGKTQAEIGLIIHSSRPTVSRLLKEARECGIVDIKLNYPFERDYTLEEEFQKNFDLKEVRVLKSYNQKIEEVLKGLGFFAAEYLDSLIVDGDIISCSYGRTVASTIQALHPERKLNITVVQMIGALGVENPFIDGPDLVRLLSDKYGGKYRYLLAPLVVSDKIAKESLVNQIRFQETIKLSQSARIGLCGIGGMNEDTPSPIWINYISNREWADLRRQGAVGHMGAYFYGKDGEIINTEMNERVIGLGLHLQREIPYMIAVAGGENKASSIRAALQGHYMKILVTDDSAARMIMNHLR
ncbi:MAG: sugar-binding transcriptional regulator [Chloroflexi bacterium]|jgi:deoxyribonucleoside regulator|nr:sugar-binding transcriptional regulator [Chloroflexota bacterium]